MGEINLFTIFVYMYGGNSLNASKDQLILIQTIGVKY